MLVLAAAVNSLIVLIHNVFALLAIRLDDEFLHLLNGEVNGDHFRDAEEGRLENGVRAVAEADFLCNLRGVDVVDRNVVLGKVTLGVVGQVLCQLLAFPDGVEEEGAVVAQAAQHVVHVQICLNVASHEVRGLNLIGRADGRVAEAEVRAGEAARLLRVVGEVSLAILVGVVADNLHGVLIGTHRTVCAEAVELGFEDAFAAECHFLFEGQGAERHVVHDAHGEVVLRFVEGKVFVDGDNHCGRGVARAETVASADDEGTVLLVVESVLHVEVKRFAVSAGFFRAVEHSNALARLGHGGEEVLGRERAIEVNADHADLFALGVEIVDGLAGSLGHRTHADDDALGVFCAVIGEEFVFATCNLAHCSHVFLNDGRHGIVVFVANLAVCEERFGVLGHASCFGVLGREGAVAEFAHLVHRHEGADVFHIHLLNLLILVGGAETVEEVDKRHAAFEGSEMGNGRKVHDFLHRAFAEHGKARLAACHDIAVVAEDTERVRGKGAGRYVEHAGQQLAGNLVHVGNHQQQALRGGESCGERTCLQRTVHGTGGTAFRLHFLYLHRVAKEVLATLG